jgi:nucleolar MIF4G domain-containing protein 1
VAKKKAAALVTEAPPKKKKKKELRLPNARTDDAEDGEIEWLEYTLRNEKGKGKEEDSDGLDGECGEHNRKLIEQTYSTLPT